MANLYVVNMPFNASDWSGVTAGDAGLTLRRAEISYELTGTYNATPQFLSVVLYRLTGISGGSAPALNPLYDGSPVSPQATAFSEASATGSTSLTEWIAPDTASNWTVELDGQMGITVAPGDSIGLKASVSGGASYSGTVNLYVEE